MSRSTKSKPESEPSELSAPDVVDVIDRTDLIENVINQIIVGYCKPRKEAWGFMWSIVLDTSVMSLGAKVKVVMAVSHEMRFKLDKNALHRVIALRNAFAHHSTNAHPVLVVGCSPEERTSYFQLLVLESSGKVSRIKRDEAFAEFNVAYRAARDSLVQLNNMVRKKFERDDA